MGPPARAASWSSPGFDRAPKAHPAALMGTLLQVQRRVDEANEADSGSARLRADNDPELEATVAAAAYNTVYDICDVIERRGARRNLGTISYAYYTNQSPLTYAYLACSILLILEY